MSPEYEFGKKSREEQAKLEEQRRAGQERRAAEKSAQEARELAERQAVEARDRQFAANNPQVSEVLQAYASSVTPIFATQELQVSPNGREVVIKDLPTGWTKTLITVSENDESGLSIKFERDDSRVSKIDEHVEEIAKYVQEATGKEVSVKRQLTRLEIKEIYGGKTTPDKHPYGRARI